MKDPYEVLRAKEQDVAVVKQQVEALRLVARLLDDDESPKQADAKLGPVQVVK